MAKQPCHPPPLTSPAPPASSQLRRPKLLLFDEATSTLDSLTEGEITDTIRDISAEGRQITLLIAHRLSTILHADRIYVLEKGDIVETGSHDQLLAEKGCIMRCGGNRSGSGRRRCFR